MIVLKGIDWPHLFNVSPDISRSGDILNGRSRCTDDTPLIYLRRARFPQRGLRAQARSTAALFKKLRFRQVGILL